MKNRTRISVISVNGEMRPVFSKDTFFGKVRCVHVTSETPEHAESWTRKVAAYKRKLMLSKVENLSLSQREKLFNVLGSRDYRRVIGL